MEQDTLKKTIQKAQLKFKKFKPLNLNIMQIIKEHH